MHDMDKRTPGNLAHANELIAFHANGIADYHFRVQLDDAQWISLGDVKERMRIESQAGVGFHRTSVDLKGRLPVQADDPIPFSLGHFEGGGDRAPAVRHTDAAGHVGDGQNDRIIDQPLIGEQTGFLSQRQRTGAPSQVVAGVPQVVEKALDQSLNPTAEPIDECEDGLSQAVHAFQPAGYLLFETGAFVAQISDHGGAHRVPEADHQGSPFQTSVLGQDLRKTPSEERHGAGPQHRIDLLGREPVGVAGQDQYGLYLGVGRDLVERALEALDGRFCADVDDHRHLLGHMRFMSACEPLRGTTACLSFFFMSV